MIIDYHAPPTVASMMSSEAFLRLIMGPVGSGKTTGIIFEMLRRACLQRRGHDGFRRTRFAIVRQTLAQLKMTVLLDIMHWLRPIATYKVSDSLVTIRFNDVVSEWFMIPMEDPEDQKRLLSMQLTGAWISEAIEINPDLVSAISGRCGRYPSAAEGGATWFGILADTNAPVVGSPWWKLMEEEPPLDWAFFIQPGGLDPNAENLDWLVQTEASMKLPIGDPVRRRQGRTYYDRLAANPNKDWVKRYVHAQFGEDPGGTAVFRESFKRSFHVALRGQPQPEVIVGHPLLIGQDFGRNPCSLICQPDHLGRLLVHEEVVSEDLGLESHVNKVLKPILFQERYLGRLMAAVGDPSGVAKNDTLEETSFDTLHRLGIPAFPSTTNNIDARIRAVEALLHQQRDGKAALWINEERCPMLVRAMNGAYRFAKTKAGATKPLPDKSHPWSDLCDGLEYVCLVFNAGTYMSRQLKRIQRRPQREPRERLSAAAWT